jgi:hypothetical protein
MWLRHSAGRSQDFSPLKRACLLAVSGFASMERNEQISHLFVLAPSRGKMRAAGTRVTRPMQAVLAPAAEHETLDCVRGYVFTDKVG